MKHSTKYLWPTIAILAGCIAAWVTQPYASAYPASAISESPSPKIEEVRGVTEAFISEDRGERIEGRVAEIISVPSYTYLRIERTAAETSSASGDVWAAVATAKVEVGQKVAVVGAQLMNDFNSKTLQRTFHTIYFGALAGESDPSRPTAVPAKRPHPPSGAAEVGSPDSAMAGLPLGHPPIGAVHPNDMTGSVSPAPTGDGLDMAPHSAPAAGGDQIPVGKVERASGPMGHTVSEIVQKRGELVGKQVRVRGVVVKSMAGVLGRTFAHLRDGSGNSASSDHDLTVTCQEDLKVGATAMFEGTVIVNKDFGAGYSYPVLLENARVVVEK